MGLLWRRRILDVLRNIIGAKKELGKGVLRDQLH